MVRFDEDSKKVLARAAELRRVSDYVRTITVAQARREVASAGEQTISRSPDEQLAGAAGSVKTDGGSKATQHSDAG